MNFHNASFSASYGYVEQIPESRVTEIVFCGRSNVGKSSLLNKLLYRKSLAKVSSKPGKTATINFYSVDGVDFVDLPGYGFAHASKKEQNAWKDLIEGYFKQERRIAVALVLLDIRREQISTLDTQMIEYIQALNLPFYVVLTKADKLSRSGVNKQVSFYAKQLNLGSENICFPVSAEKNLNIDLLRNYIEQAI